MLRCKAARLYMQNTTVALGPMNSSLLTMFNKAKVMRLQPCVRLALRHIGITRPRLVQQHIHRLADAWCQTDQRLRAAWRLPHPQLRCTKGQV